MVVCRVDPEAGRCMCRTVDPLEANSVILAHRLHHYDPKPSPGTQGGPPPHGWAEKNECRTGPGGFFHFRRLIAAEIYTCAVAAAAGVGCERTAYGSGWGQRGGQPRLATG